MRRFNIVSTAVGPRHRSAGRKKANPKNCYLNLRVSEHLMARLVACAIETRRGKSVVVRAALEQYLCSTVLKVQ